VQPRQACAGPPSALVRPPSPPSISTHRGGYVMAAFFLVGAPSAVIVSRWCRCLLAHMMMILRAGLPARFAPSCCLPLLLSRSPTPLRPPSPCSRQCGYFTDKVNRVHLLFIIVLVGQGPCVATYFVSSSRRHARGSQGSGCAHTAEVACTLLRCSSPLPSHQRHPPSPFLHRRRPDRPPGHQLLAVCHPAHAHGHRGRRGIPPRLLPAGGPLPGHPALGDGVARPDSDGPGHRRRPDGRGDAGADQQLAAAVCAGGGAGAGAGAGDGADDQGAAEVGALARWLAAAGCLWGSGVIRVVAAELATQL